MTPSLLSITILTKWRGSKVNRTFTIGIILPDVTNLFFNDILRGVETEARRNGYANPLPVLLQ